jgi:hypothetical protein
MLQKIRLSRLFLIFITLEIIQLWFFSFSKPATPAVTEPLQPQPIPIPQSTLDLEEVYTTCLKTFATPSKIIPMLSEDPIPKQPKKKINNICNNGFLDKKLSRCICDIRNVGNYCNISVSYTCEEDIQRASIFENIWDTGVWQSGDSKSGPGSTVWYTKGVREFLPKIVKKYNITSLLDSPCGDFNWMKYTRFPEGFEYVGVDVLNKAIVKNRAENEENDMYGFYQTDIVVYPPYKSFDLIFTRDTMQHLSNADRERILANYENSGAKYLCASYYTGTWDNSDGQTAQTRNLNLLQHPYNFPEPLEVLVDKNPSMAAGTGSIKTMGLWKLPIKRED